MIRNHALSNRPRVSAAVIRADNHTILMVQHRRPGASTYWQLPGGGIDADEQPETAVLRELAEETGLTGHVVQHLFVIPYKHGFSTTYLVAVDDYTPLHLGCDPEERDTEHPKLIDAAWQSMRTMIGNPEIDALHQALAQRATCSNATKQV